MTSSTDSNSPMLALETIAKRILHTRGARVMLDADLADLYGVPTKALNQAVRRNLDRFPADFMFQLNKAEKLKSVTSRDHLAKLETLERKLGSHDQAIAGLINAIRQLTQVPAPASRPIGFTADLSKSKRR
jgi:hypothetical protein